MGRIGAKADEVAMCARIGVKLEDKGSYFAQLGQLTVTDCSVAGVHCNASNSLWYSASTTVITSSVSNAQGSGALRSNQS
jgi:hypothetical protein